MIRERELQRRTTAWTRLLLAGAFAAWLVPGSAAAQQPRPVPTPPTASPLTQHGTSPTQHGTPPADAGASPASPTAQGHTERPELFVVGASTMRAYVEVASKALQAKYVLPAPRAELKGTNLGIDRFCAGVGAEFPDIIAAARAMRKDEFDTCIANGVLDIIEIKIGWSGLYAVVKKGGTAIDLTPRMFYLGLAAQVPEKGEFIDNPNTTWRETSKAAPDLPIHVLVPGTASGTRSSFEGLFMQGGCRRIKEIDFIYAAADRVPKCTTLRTDGHAIEVPEPYGEAMVKALEEAPPGTVAVMSGEVYAAFRDRLTPLPIGGVVPTDIAIQRLDYIMATGNFFYFKRAHMRNKAGDGVVQGIREFMAEVTRDGVWGASGQMSKLGLVTLNADAQGDERRKVRTLKRFVR